MKNADCLAEDGDEGKRLPGMGTNKAELCEAFFVVAGMWHVQIGCLHMYFKGCLY